MSNPVTALEKRYMAEVAKLNCACCGAYGVELHHIRETLGGAQRAGNFCVIPLCRACHGQDLGSQGVHGDKTMMRIYKTSEFEMLNKTIGEVFRAVIR